MLNPLANGKFLELFKAFECFSSTFQGKFYFQDSLVHVYSSTFQACVNPVLSQILTSSKLAIFIVNGKALEMDFLHNSTTLLFLLMNKNDVAHLINQNLNLHVLLFIFNRKNNFWVKNTGFYQKILVQIFAKGMFFVYT